VSAAKYTGFPTMSWIPNLSIYDVPDWIRFMAFHQSFPNLLLPKEGITFRFLADQEATKFRPPHAAIHVPELFGALTEESNRNEISSGRWQGELPRTDFSCCKIILPRKSYSIRKRNFVIVSESKACYLLTDSGTGGNNSNSKLVYLD
jgi:hypothetical protein